MGLIKKYHILLILLSIKKIVALKIDGVKEAIKENNNKNKLTIINDNNSLHLILFKINIKIEEKIDICKPDNANKWVIPLTL